MLEVSVRNACCAMDEDMLDLDAILLQAAQDGIIQLLRGSLQGEKWAEELIEVMVSAPIRFRS